MTEPFRHRLRPHNIPETPWVCGVSGAYCSEDCMMADRVLQARDTVKMSKERLDRALEEMNDAR